MTLCMHVLPHARFKRNRNKNTNTLRGRSACDRLRIVEHTQKTNTLRAQSVKGFKKGDKSGPRWADKESDGVPMLQLDD